MLGQQIRIKYTTTVDGKTVTKTTVADDVYSVDGRVVIGEVKSGGAVLSPNQAGLEKAIASGDLKDVVVCGSNATEKGIAGNLSDLAKQEAASYRNSYEPDGETNLPPTDSGQVVYQKIQVDPTTGLKQAPWEDTTNFVEEYNADMESGDWQGFDRAADAEGVDAWSGDGPWGPAGGVGAGEGDNPGGDPAEGPGDDPGGDPIVDPIGFVGRTLA